MTIMTSYFRIRDDAIKIFGKGTMLAVLEKIRDTFLIPIHISDYTLTCITIYSYQLISIGPIIPYIQWYPHTPLGLHIH